MLVALRVMPICVRGSMSSAIYLFLYYVLCAVL
uniref:Uncharacterized protein n=1 Tax=Anguilla anguilla TaxID=7936 RepID=A0A0E9V914_ANGAN